MSHHIVVFQPWNKSVEVSSFETLLDAALKTGIPLDHVCGGGGSCTTCHVEIVEGLEGLDPPEGEEEDKLNELDCRTKSSRLACQTLVQGNLIVRTPIL